jgi:hypothetical protein
LTPQLFAHTPLELVWHEGRAAEPVHRFQLGRTRADASPSGGDAGCQELALAGWAQAGLDQRFHDLDTTRVSRTGAYVPAREAHALMLPHGYATDQRPALQPVVWARLGSPDGGVPWVSTRGEGQTADLHVCQERAQAWMTACAPTPRPRSLVAAATRSPADQAPDLQPRGGIPRRPHPLRVVAQVSRPALAWDTWPPVDDHLRSQRLA